MINVELTLREARIHQDENRSKEMREFAADVVKSIEQLKGVIAKCDSALNQISYVEPSWVASKVREALAAIEKEYKP